MHPSAPPIPISPVASTPEQRIRRYCEQRSLANEGEAVTVQLPSIEDCDALLGELACLRSENAKLPAPRNDEIVCAIGRLVESLDRNTAATQTLLQAILVAATEDDQPDAPADEGEEPPAFEVARK